MKIENGQLTCHGSTFGAVAVQCVSFAKFKHLIRFKRFGLLPQIHIYKTYKIRVTNNLYLYTNADCCVTFMWNIA